VPAQGGFSLATTSTVSGLTVDTHGNLWVLYADGITTNFAVEEFAAGSIAPSVGQYSTPVPVLNDQLQIAVQAPLGFAVDTSGDVFGAVPQNSDELYAIAAPVVNNAPVASDSFPVLAGVAPDEIAVDASGRIYATGAGPNIFTYTYTNSTLNQGQTVVDLATIVAPVAIVNDSAGNIFEIDNDSGFGGSNVRVNGIANGAVARSAQLPLSVHAGQLAHDPTTDYTYVLSDDGAVALNVYPPFSGTTSTLLPMATLLLSQQAFNVSGIALDANYVYIPSANNVTLYPKYDPTKPYAGWRAYKPAANTTRRALEKRR
jgi:hypothetical protein